MWSFHDDFRKSVRRIEDILSGTEDIQVLNRELGRLFFVVFPIIFREEKIVFPVAYKAIPENTWSEMLAGSMEIGWCYDVKPRLQKKREAEGIDTVLFDLGTGLLSPEQVSIMLDTLPVDITYIDENDEVIYFSGSRHRIFPRSNAIIGRKVQNCHPPESVHIVNEIIDAFRNGSKDHADFHINMKGRFIQIRYFALRNELKEYKGVIEVSQDITEIRNLEGEKRLLDWNI
jgi:PAS domain S-box-containing protein